MKTKLLRKWLAAVAAEYRTPKARGYWTNVLAAFSPRQGETARGLSPARRTLHYFAMLEWLGQGHRHDRTLAERFRWKWRKYSRKYWEPDVVLRRLAETGKTED